MPFVPSTSKKQPLTLSQISAYDDILTDALVDHAYYWTTIPKNRTTYHPSRGVTEEGITKILQSDLIVEPNVSAAETKLLGTDGLRRFYNVLKTDKEKDDFRQHLHRYMQIYLPDCPFEVNTTNRYTIVTHEASVTARRFIKKSEAVKYLSGIRVLMTEKEEKEISARKKDFSIVVSSRNKCASLFMGPARFANHDCGANARLAMSGQSSIEIIATQNIELGDEITVTYGDNYFGEDNCECLCRTCEINLANGWAQPDGVVAVKESIEESQAEGYSLRRRRRVDSSARSSREPSITPDIRPRISKSRSKTFRISSSQVFTIESPTPETLLRQKRKREFEVLTTPPVTPAKKLKTLQYDMEAIPVPESLSRRSSVGDSSGSATESDAGSAETALTDITTKEIEIKEPEASFQSPTATPTKANPTELKIEDSELSSPSEVAVTLSPVTSQNVVSSEPFPTTEAVFANVPATGIPADTAVIQTSGVDKSASEPMDVIVIPPPLTPAAKSTEQFLATPTEEVPIPKRGRGRPRGSGKKSKSADVTLTPRKETITSTEEPVAPTATRPTGTRTPGDYKLTDILLSEPNTAWIGCTNCAEYFVQRNAYYTRSSCPRCERHSKLYGYQWPKTELEGESDTEERILDHRVVHRFLGREDEAKARGKKGLNGALSAETPDVEASDKKKKAEAHEDELASATRRSGRRRNPSLKASAF